MLLKPECDTQQWANDNFDDAPLGDKRRCDRLVTMARQVADQPAAGLPKIGEDWGGVKGIYRLLDRPEATLQSVTHTHRNRITQQEGTFLILSDTMHVDFGRDRKLPDAGPVGAGKSKGFLLHSGLMVNTDDDSLVGLAGQTAHVRSQQKKGKQNDAQRLKRWRESEMWSELFEQVGSPAEGSQFIHVCDSAADNFEVYCTVKQRACEFVIRAGRMHRKVIAKGNKSSLSKLVSDLPELGTYEQKIARGNDRKARTAKLRVSAKAIELPIPSSRGERVKQYAKQGGGDIPAWVVVVEEMDPPANVEPIRWVLLSSVPVESFDDARQIIRWYELRWTIEEWHKAIKSGCRLESRQLQSIDRLLPLTGVLSVVSILLLKLRSAARTEPNRPARERVPPLWLALLKAKGNTKSTDLTNYEFWRALAKLGGFLGRRSDGEPGWQTIWRGWKILHTYIEGVELAKRCG